MDRNKINHLRRFNNKQGFTIIEALIVLSLFSIGFMALTAMVWSASRTTANTTRADFSIMAGRDLLESLSSMPIAHAKLDGGEYEIQISDPPIQVQWEALDFTDADDDGSPEFKTIVIRAFSQEELRMESYYRRKIN